MTAGRLAEHGADSSLPDVPQLMSMAAHEMRSPLAAIQNWIYVLQAEKSLSSLGRRATDGVLAGIQEQVRLIEQLADIGAAFEESSVSELQPEQIEERLAAAVLDREPSAEERGIELERDGVATGAVVETDPGLLQRLLALLLSRSLRAVGRGGRVQIGAAVEEGRLCLRINNPARSERLPAPSRNGRARADLGWLLACRFAELLDARLERAAGDEGSDYLVELPLKRSPSGRREPSPAIR